MGTNPGSKKKAERRLVDMSSEPECYAPPPASECRVYNVPIDLDDDGRLRIHASNRVYKNKTVHFSVSIQLRQHSLADWQEVFRIDTTHGTVHQHRFRPDGTEDRNEIETIPVSGGHEVVAQWFKKARQRCHDEWQTHVRGWLK